MKNFYPFLVVALVNLFIHSAYAQYPFVIESIADVDLHIRVSPDWGAGYFDDISDGQRLVAIDEDGDDNGWYQVCVMDPYGYKIGYVNKGYVEGTYVYFDALCSANYVEITDAPSGLVIREYAGADFDDVVWMDGEWAACWNGQLFATTGDEEVIGGVTWFEIYLTDDCSQMTGWVSGTYCDEFTSGDCDFPDMPDAFEIDDVSETTMHLDWVSGGGDVDFYNIYYCGAFSPFATTTSTSFTVTGLIPGVEYSFFITAVSGFGVSDPTDCVTDVTDGDSPDMPTGFVLEDITTNSMQADWYSAAGADLYEVWDCMTEVSLGTTTNTYMNFTGLTPGTMHGYKVRSKTYGGEYSPWTTCLYAWTEDAAGPGLPLNFEYTDITESTATLDWDAPVGGADGYEIYDCYDDMIIAYTTATTFTVIDIEPVTNIGYAVRAVSGGFYSAYTDCIYDVTLEAEGPGVPTGLTVTSTSETSVSLDWGYPATGADSYEVKNCVSGSIVASPIPSFVTLTGLTPGTNYLFAVRSYQDGLYSAWTSCISVTTDAAPGAPGMPLSFEIDGILETSIIYDWVAPASGADYYQFKNCMTGTIISSPASTAYTVTGLDAGEYFSGQVRTVKDGMYSAWTSCLGGTTLTPDPDNFIHYIEFNSFTEGVYVYETPTFLGEAYGDDPYDALTPLKVCADGSNATLISLMFDEVEGLENIRLRIAGDPYGVMSETTGWFIYDDYTIDGAWLHARYTHPKYYDGLDMYRSEVIEVVDIVSGEVLYSYPLEIYHEPITFVHGLMGSDEAFNPVQNALQADGMYPEDGHLIHVLNYFSYSFFGFLENSWIVPNGIQETIEDAREHGYSCGKSTVVAHSMGGMLSRLYLQSEAYRDDINKLVLIGVPNSGSPVADLATATFESVYMTFEGYGITFPFDVWAMLDDYLFEYGIFDYCDAAFDLRTDSYMIDTYLNEAYIDDNSVPTHVLSFDISESLGAMPYYWILSLVLSDWEINNIIFMGMGHDGVVQVPSMECGLSGSEITDYLIQFHMDEQNTPGTIARIKTLIKSKPDGPLFEGDGVGPVPDINSYFSVIFRTEDLSDEPLVSSIVETDLEILSPDTIATYSDGEVIEIMVNGVPEINKISLSIGSKEAGVDTLIFIEGNVANIEYRIEKGHTNPIVLMAAGYTDELLVDYDFLTLDMEIDQDPVQLVLPDDVYVVSGGSTELTIKAMFEDNIERNISDRPDLSIFISDDSLAQICIEPAVLCGLLEGETELLVSYRGLVDTVDIHVLKADLNVFLTVPNNSEFSSDTLDITPIRFYPNPTEGEATFLWKGDYHATDFEQLDAIIYNVFGEEVGILTNLKKTGGNSYSVSLNGFPSGLYVIKIINDTGVFSSGVCTKL